MKATKSLLPETLYSLDWISFTVWCDATQIQSILELWDLWHDLEDLGHGGMGFRDLKIGAYGSKLYSDPVRGNSWFYHVVLPGQAVQFLGVDTVMLGLSLIQETGWKFSITRIDFAFDTQRFTTADFWGVLEADNYHTKVQRKSIHRFVDLDQTSYTIYVGAPSSRARLRVYTKSVPGHKCLTGDFCRVELQLRAERAHDAGLALLANSTMDWAQLSAARLRGLIDLDCDWWQDWLKGIERAWLTIQIKAPTVERIEHWLYRQVAPSLATWTLAKSQGDVDALIAQIRELIRDGHERMDAQKQRLVERYTPPSERTALPSDNPFGTD